MAPDEAPPSYEAAAKSRPAGTGAAGASSSSSAAIPPEVRRSMEDAHRPLPKGWVKQWDPKQGHNFFVDTQAKPPRSIWAHPLDDETYRRHNPEEARALEEQTHMLEFGGPDESGGASGLAAAANSPRRSSMIDPQTRAALHDESSADEAESRPSQPKSAKPAPTGLKKLGRNVKDKLTQSTHEQRVTAREKKREAERKAYEMHQEIRQRLMKATATGQPQLVGRDKSGRDIYAQPPPQGMGMYGGGATLGYTPYQTSDRYAYGPGSYAAPMSPYGRQLGYGYGGGMGLPIMGGMMGGMMLGGLLF